MSGLTSLFSDSTKEKFARVYKAEEFQAPPKKVKVPVEGEAVDPVPIELDDGKKKRKPRKERKPESDDTAAASSSGEGDAPAEAGNTEVACTIFVGNVPVKETTKSITNFFKTYGEIDSVRLRSVPVAGAKVDEAGNQDLVRKVCVNAKKFGEQKGSFNAYIRFKEAAAAKAALAANNQIMGGRHLRVDGSTPSLFEPKRSIFVGGLPHYADEEEVREFFAAALPNGHEDIEGLRLIRDAATLVGKGIGYVLFKERESVLKGLALHKSMYKKRWALRISACGKRTKRTEQGKTEGTEASKTEGAGSTGKRGNSSSGSKEDEGDEDQKKKKQRTDNNPAMRRIKLKSVVTRNKVLTERKQKKNRPGKRLGGVVKKAIKAATAAGLGKPFANKGKGKR